MDAISIRFSENLSTHVSGQAYLHKVEQTYGMRSSSGDQTENVFSQFFSGLKQVICRPLFSDASNDIGNAYHKLRQNIALHYQSLMNSPGGPQSFDFTKDIFVTLDGNNKLFQVKQRHLGNGNFELKLGFATEDEKHHTSIEINDLNKFVQELLMAAESDTFLALKSEIQMECGYSMFDSVFVVTNELNSEKVINSLKEKPITGNTGIYTSGLFSLDLAAAERDNSGGDIDKIIVIDRAPIVRDFWTSIGKIIRETETREEAFREIKNLITENSNQYFPQGGSKTAEVYISLLQKKLDNEMSFLSADEKYKKIRDIFCKDRFVFISLDLCDQDHTKRLGDLIAASTLNIDTLYVSNIYGLLLSDLEEARKRQGGGDYESYFTAELMSKLCESGLFDEARNVSQLSFDDKRKRFSGLFNEEKEHKQALSTILQRTERMRVGREQQIRDAENACNLFAASMENILGQSSSDTHFIHASRRCDKGCCINPLRIDKGENLSETLKIKTPCYERDPGSRRGVLNFV